MTPSARVQAAIDLLDLIIVAAREGGAAADTLIARWFAERRFAGSKDRRAIRDLVYAAIRRSGERPEHGRAAMVGLAREDEALAALFDGSGYGPAPITADEESAAATAIPAWLIDRFSPLVDAGERTALVGRAPLDLRVNRLKGDRATVLAGLDGAQPTPHAPDGVRLAENVQIEQSGFWKDGLVEVQDEGSQLLALACAAAPGMVALDLCAGAGGKTLALAAAMQNRGRLVASDTVRDRLRRLEPRATRAGATIIETVLLDEGREAEALADLRNATDLVLIDAPCSGTGTWRRNPEARWRLTPERLQRVVAVQARLMEIAAGLVRPGGALIYAVCSLVADEGAAQVAAFLDRNPGWRAVVPLAEVGRTDGAGILLTPGHDRTDGFFVARLIKP